jgi:hypothetical protein
MYVMARKKSPCFKSLEFKRKFISHLGQQIFRIRELMVEMVQYVPDDRIEPKLFTLLPPMMSYNCLIWVGWQRTEFFPSPLETLGKGASSIESDYN